MMVARATGEAWTIDDAEAKLAARARLPGARVFDLAASSLRTAKAQGMTLEDRLVLALPASWLVNSPAISRVLRRWALPPDRETWIALVDRLEGGDPAHTGGGLARLVRALGTEPTLVEAVSKVLALLVPEAVPLMPAPARTFVLGANAPDDEQAFVAMVAWFQREVRAHEAELAALADRHAEVRLTGAQVLDRLLWFDSEGHRHFPAGFSSPG